MFSLSSLDVRYLVKEIKPLVEEAFVDKVYHDGNDFLFKLRSPSKGKQMLYIKPPEAFFLTQHRFGWPGDPNGFCMQLRKHLTNAKIVSIEQHAFERIVEVVFVKGDARWRLVLELFSKGNVLLVNSDGLIRGVMDLQRWKDRTLRVNAPYEYPPAVVSTPELSEQGLLDLYDGRALVKFCATSLALGGKYAEEFVARYGFDKMQASLPDGFFASLQEFVNQALSPSSSGGDVAPIPLQGWSVSESSFSELVEAVVIGEKVKDIDDEAKGQVASRESKYERIISEQSAKLEGYQVSALENQRKGELIYEHYQDLSALFARLKELHAKGGWPAVKSFIEEKKLKVSVDEKNGSVMVSL